MSAVRLFPIPMAVVSRCLGFAACRYDGGQEPFSWAERWRGYVRFQTVCPEVEMGLGVPRPPIRLVGSGATLRLMQPETGEDWTDRMNAFTRAWLDDLDQADGFIFREKSPSCGLRKTKRFQGLTDTEPIGLGAGLFAEAAVARHFLKPAAEAGDLEGALDREHFLVRLFASAAVGQARRAQSLEALGKAYDRYRPLVESVWPARAEELDRILAPRDWTAFDRVADAFEEGLLGALKRWRPRSPAPAEWHLYPDALRDA